MKKWLVTLFLGVTSFFAEGQAQNELSLINEQVWRPFIEAYNGYHARAFMALHTEDVIRVSRGNKQILVGTDYRKSIFRGNSISRLRKHEREIELRFLDRIVNGDLAYEVGYYKIVSRKPRMDEVTYYGLFHVVLKKIDGAWKIYVDSDEEVSLSSEQFTSARQLFDF